jgi:aconitase A
MKKDPEPVKDIFNANVLGLFGDSITTDHISPAGSFRPETPAGAYLVSRGTFANIRLKNEMVASGKEGGYTTYVPTNEETTIHGRTDIKPKVILDAEIKRIQRMNLSTTKTQGFFTTFSEN